MPLPKNVSDLLSSPEDLAGSTASAVVVAGGRGARLRPLTDERPKPLLEVGSTTIIEHVIAHLVGEGVTDIVISVCFEADQICETLGDGSSLGCSISYLREAEDRPLGTAGWLSLLDEALLVRSRPLLVVNGDLMTDCDLSVLFERASETSAAAVVGTVDYSHRIPFGVVDRSGPGATVIREKPLHSWDVLGGIYLLDLSQLPLLAAETALSMVDLLHRLQDEDRRIEFVPLVGRWVDVARPDDLIAVRRDWVDHE